MIIETAISLDELDEIRAKSKSNVRLILLGRVETNGIQLNRILIEGQREEIERFMEKLRLARAGG